MYDNENWRETIFIAIRAEYILGTFEESPNISNWLAQSVLAHYRSGNRGRISEAALDNNDRARGRGIEYGHEAVRKYFGKSPLVCHI
jgi:hypothetical protein